MRNPAPFPTFGRRATFCLLALTTGCYVDRAPTTLTYDSAVPQQTDAGELPETSADAPPKMDAGARDAAGGADAAIADAAVTDAASSADAQPEGEESDPDTDIALVRFNVDGSLDETFGTYGVAKVDFGPGSAATRDAIWNIALDNLDRFLVFGSKKGAGTRIDFDRVIARLTPTGSVDTTFATAGFFTTTFTNLNLNDQSRGGALQPDGKILSVGFTPAPTGVGTQTSNRLLLLRLWGGALDQTFGASGLVSMTPFIPADPINTQWGSFEPTAIALQKGGGIVTAGFGRATAAGDLNQMTMRHTADGVLDPTWGTAGVQQVDVAKQPDRGRSMVVLADDRVVVVGGASPRANIVHPLVAILLANGALDTSFNNPNPGAGGRGSAASGGAGGSTGGGGGGTGAGGAGGGAGAGGGGAGGSSGAAGASASGGNAGRAGAGGAGGSSGAAAPVSPTLGYKLYDFGNPNEEFYGVAAAPSGNWLAAAGFSAVGGSTADSILAFIPLRSTAGVEVARAAPTSPTTEDRFFAVTFDQQDRAYAAGFVTRDGDSRMVLARFISTGALDPTFGAAGGVIIINVADGGGTLETARAVIVQRDGKIVIAGEFER